MGDGVTIGGRGTRFRVLKLDCRRFCSSAGSGFSAAAVDSVDDDLILGRNDRPLLLLLLLSSSAAVTAAISARAEMARIARRIVKGRSLPVVESFSPRIDSNDKISSTKNDPENEKI